MVPQCNDTFILIIQIERNNAKQQQHKYKIETLKQSGCKKKCPASFVVGYFVPADCFFANCGRKEKGIKFADQINFCQRIDTL